MQMAEVLSRDTRSPCSWEFGSSSICFRPVSAVFSVSFLNAFLKCLTPFQVFRHSRSNLIQIYHAVFYFFSFFSFLFFLCWIKVVILIMECCIFFSVIILQLQTLQLSLGPTINVLKHVLKLCFYLPIKNEFLVLSFHWTGQEPNHLLASLLIPHISIIYHF